MLESEHTPHGSDVDGGGGGGGEEAAASPAIASRSASGAAEETVEMVAISPATFYF